MVDLLWVSLPPDDLAFLKVRETLSRIGILSFKVRENGKKDLIQSCFILHKKIAGISKYAIVHFKEMFLLDGKKDTDFTVEDIGRRNRIARLLAEWDLVILEKPFTEKDPMADMVDIKIVKSSEKSNYNLKAKYLIGKKK